MFSLSSVLRIVFFTFILLLAGCATKIEYRDVIVEKVKYIVQSPPDSLLADCKISKPPGQSYVTLTYPEKETVMVDYAVEQTVNLGECNKDKAALRKWKTEQSAVSAK